MKRLLIAAAGYVSLMSAPAPASPQEDMCALTAALSNDGVKTAVRLIEGLAERWSREQRAKLGVIIGSELDKFRYHGGQVYRTAALPGAVEEYFITMNVTDGGSVFLRVLYEGSGGTLSFVNIDFKSSYYESISRPFLQAPQPVDCR